jgi:hypothetical protein
MMGASKLKTWQFLAIAYVLDVIRYLYHGKHRAPYLATRKGDGINPLSPAFTQHSRRFSER